MNSRLRPLVAGLVVATTVVLAAPSSAAPSRTLYFDNQGAADNASCATVYVLVRTSTHGHPCGHVMAVVAGTGYYYIDSYASVGKATGFRLDARRHVTGTVYLSSYMYLNLYTD